MRNVNYIIILSIGVFYGKLYGLDDISYISMPTENQCIEHGDDYQVAIHPKCKDVAQNLTSPRAMAYGKSDNVQVIGHRNLLFIEFEKKIDEKILYLISGKKSKLHQIKSVDVFKNKVLVLNNSAENKMELLVFSFSSGNVLPSKVISLDGLNIEKAIFGHQGQKIYATDSKTGEIFMYQSSSDSRSVAAHKRPTAKIMYSSEIPGLNTPISLVLLDKQKAFMLDRDTQQIHTLDIKTTPWKVIKTYRNEDLSQLNPIDLKLLESNFLTVYGKQGQKIKVTLQLLM